MGVQHLARERGHPAAAIPAPENRRGGDHHDPLPVCTGHVPSTVYPELDLEILVGGTLGWNRGHGGHCADGAILGLLLDLLHQGLERKEVRLAGIEPLDLTRDEGEMSLETGGLGRIV